MSLYEPLRARDAWGVAALLLAANDALQVRFGACTVRGELSGLTRATSGHSYFTLKDAGGAAATLRCAMFRRAASLLDFTPRDGQQVELRGRLAVYEARGELQMVVEAMQRVGAGSLYEEFLRLKARLEAQGLFDASRKRPMPAFPARLGIVTSLGAAALRDVVTTLQRRAPHVRLVVYPSLVQGADAPAALVDALALANQRKEVDALLLCRGGGSLEDLWAFNDERVVRAIAASALPLICGVGHETDVTLADLAADLRAPTPTAAAELAAPARQEAWAQLQGLALRSHRATSRRLEGQALRLDQLAMRLARPGLALARHGHVLDRHDARRRAAWAAARAAGDRRLQQAGERLQRAQRLRLQRAHERLDALQHRLQALDPRRVLARGYAWITDESQQPVLSVTRLQAGQALRAVWSDGEALTEVKSIQLAPPQDSA
jgi:exodeoxyribonuclease VII large subunit